jgi:hypothetical protein
MFPFRQFSGSTQIYSHSVPDLAECHRDDLDTDTDKISHLVHKDPPCQSRDRKLAGTQILHTGKGNASGFRCHVALPVQFAKGQGVLKT